MIVVDANIIAARKLTCVLTSKAEKVEKKDPVWVVPVLWRYEFQNILATAIKTGRITPEQALMDWHEVHENLVDNECELTPAMAIDLVTRYGITAYDAQYVALAIEMGVACVTENRELQEKFPDVAVSMDRFLMPRHVEGVHAPKAKYKRRRT